MYAWQLWKKIFVLYLKRVRIANNNLFRFLHRFLKYTSVCKQQMLHNVTVFYAIIQKWPSHLFLVVINLIKT